MPAGETAPRLAVHGPYEDLAIAVIELIKVVVEGQPAEVRLELWRMYLEDLRAWREFWSQGMKLLPAPAKAIAEPQS